jgi:hypothetical protein
MAQCKVPVWPRSTNRATEHRLSPFDHQSTTAHLNSVASKLFKQDGTVEILACQWSKDRTYTSEFGSVFELT